MCSSCFFTSSQVRSAINFPGKELIPVRNRARDSGFKTSSSFSTVERIQNRSKNAGGYVPNTEMSRFGLNTNNIQRAAAEAGVGRSIEERD